MLNTLRHIKNFLLRPITIRRGQLQGNSEAGAWLKFLASRSDVRSIVEIGTWNGKGSSQLIAKGVKARTDSRTWPVVMGLEADAALAAKAQRHLRKYNFFDVIHGCIVTEADVDSENLTAQEVDWLNGDLSNMSKAPYVLAELPKAIDLILLDGGEFTTYAEFKILKNRLRGWVLLDDTKTRKCKKILSELRASTSFSIVFESDERNGTALARYIEKAPTL